MPSLSHDISRHVIIDKRKGHYCCFPDICLTHQGRILVVYRETDKHVATRSKLLVKASEDQGVTWSPARVLNAAGGHASRINVLSDGQVALLNESPSVIYWSLDHGVTWSTPSPKGIGHCVPDRLLELDTETFLTTGHLHRGVAALPGINQAPVEQMVYLSEDRGQSWQALSVMANDPRLVLCEASVTRLEDGRLLALMRENSGVFEPMYVCMSRDKGRTWSEPVPTPLIGHRPCMGVTKDGRLLVTYRNTAPDGGTAAWLGTQEELLESDFQVHGLTPDPAAVTLTPEGLHIDTRGGRDSCVLYCLRPITDPPRAKVVLEADVRVFEGERNACGLRLGAWWRIRADRIEPDISGIRGARPLMLPPDAMNRIRLEYEAGVVTVFVNNRKKRSYQVDKESVRTRPILFGNVSSDKENQGRSVFSRLKLRIEEPRYGRIHDWEWTPDKGLPDAWVRERVLELQNGGKAAAVDYGYSGWIEPVPGEFLCAYHHENGLDEDYEPWKCSHVAATRFYSSDFPSDAH